MIKLGWLVRDAGQLWDSRRLSKMLEKIPKIIYNKTRPTRGG